MRGVLLSPEHTPGMIRVKLSLKVRWSISDDTVLSILIISIMSLNRALPNMGSVDVALPHIIIRCTQIALIFRNIHSIVESAAGPASSTSTHIHLQSTAITARCGMARCTPPSNPTDPGRFFRTLRLCSSGSRRRDRAIECAVGLQDSHQRRREQGVLL